MDHVEDARDRLQLMHYPVPEPTQEAIAESQTLTESRKSVSIKSQVATLLLRKPDTIEAARVGEPTMESPPETTAPMVLREMMQMFATAVNPQAAAPVATATAARPTAPSTDTEAAPAPAATTPPVAAGPVQLQDVGSDTSGSPADATFTNVPSASQSTPTGTGVGMSIVSPSETGTTPVQTTPADETPDPNGGLKAVGPANTTPLPSVEQPAAAPESVNDVQGVGTPTAAAKASNPVVDKSTESSDKKKKKGLKKIIP
jgi:outer membrane protein assembly factor BamD